MKKGKKYFFMMLASSVIGRKIVCYHMLSVTVTSIRSGQGSRGGHWVFYLEVMEALLQ